MSNSISVQNIINLHKECIERWEHSGVEYCHHHFYRLVEENHAFNYQLWNAEDEARCDDPNRVFEAKKRIDRFNQLRNDRMEAMDESLFQELKPAALNQCPVNSESPGMIIDRLSILSLKSYHMNLQTKRQDVDESHRKKCMEKLTVIHAQLAQLAQCFLELFLEVQEKKRTFRVYHQFKMYNDPNLNPQLYHS
jgi:hypothetical protein